MATLIDDFRSGTHDTVATAQNVPVIESRSKAISAPAARVNQYEITGTDNSTVRKLRKPILIALSKNALLVRRVADGIEKRLKGKCVGYSFQVAYRDGSLIVARAGGMARRSPDSSPRAFRTEDKITIASVSKTITAITLLKLLDEKKISIDSSIASYLPKVIKQHPSIKTITFRKLLTHRSGIRWQLEPDYEALLKGLAEGVDPKLQDKTCNNSDFGFCYNNSNFGLLRILIPTIRNGYEPPANLNNYTKSYLYGIHTMIATEERVYKPLGISKVYCASEANGADRALSYQYPQPVQAGQDWGDMTATNAYRGWNLSAPQMSAVIRALIYSENLLPANLRDQMLSEQLGIWHADVGDLDEFGHGGWHPGNPIPGQYNLGEVGTVIVGYSNGISVALIVNSQYGPGLSSLDAIRPAIEEAMKDL